MPKFFRNEHAVTIAPSTIVFGVLFILGLAFLYTIREIVFIFLCATIVMSALHPAVRTLNKKLHVPRTLSIAIVYLLLILAIVALAGLVVPPLFAEVPNLIHALNLPALPDHLANFSLSLNDANVLFTQIQNSFGTIMTVISSTFQGIFAFFTIVVLSVYLLLDRENLHKKIVWFSQTERHLQLAKDFVNSLEVQLGGWVRGQLLLMLIIGVASFVGLTVLHVPYALPLAVAAGFFEILPNIGPTLAVLPALVVGFSAGGAPMAGLVLLWYVIIQQAENHYIVPKVMQKNADVSPLITILVILIGFKLASVVGALLAVPIYILLRTAYSFWAKWQDGQSAA